MRPQRLELPHIPPIDKASTDNGRQRERHKCHHFDYMRSYADDMDSVPTKWTSDQKKVFAHTTPVLERRRTEDGGSPIGNAVACSDGDAVSHCFTAWNAVPLCVEIRLSASKSGCLGLRKRGGLLGRGRHEPLLHGMECRATLRPYLPWPVTQKRTPAHVNRGYLLE